MIFWYTCVCVFSQTVLDLYSYYSYLETRHDYLPYFLKKAIKLAAEINFRSRYLHTYDTWLLRTAANAGLAVAGGSRDARSILQYKVQ